MSSFTWKAQHMRNDVIQNSAKGYDKEGTENAEH